MPPDADKSDDTIKEAELRVEELRRIRNRIEEIVFGWRHVDAKDRER